MRQTEQASQDDGESHIRLKRLKRLSTLISITLVGLAIIVFSTRAEGERISPNMDLSTIPTIGRTALIQTKTDTIDLLLYKIIFCESGGNPKAYNHSSGATGLGQFIPSTQKYVQKKWNMTLDFWDYDDNLYATRRLLEEEGERHWDESCHCWGY